METINLCDNSDFPNKIGKGTRILGIDPGKKNIGISISDPNQKIATPLKIIFMKKI
jgi:putative Holliday junction resolvase